MVRGNPSELPSLPSLPMDVRVVDATTAMPPDAKLVRGDELLGVQLDSEEARRGVEWALMQTCRRPYDGPGDRYIGRAVSLRITRRLSHTSVTPNQVTFVALLLGMFAFVLAGIGTWPHIFFAGLLMFAQVVLDSVDGELARVRYMGSKLGMWLDNISDDLIDNLLVIGLGWGIGGSWAEVGIVAAIARGFSALVTYKGASAAGSPGDVMAFRWWFEENASGPVEAYERQLSLVAALRSLGRRDTYMLVFAAACAVNLPELAFALGVTNCVTYFGLAVVHLVVRRGRC